MYVIWSVSHCEQEPTWPSRPWGQGGQACLLSHIIALPRLLRYRICHNGDKDQWNSQFSACEVWIASSIVWIWTLKPSRPWGQDGQAWNRMVQYRPCRRMEELVQCLVPLSLSPTVLWNALGYSVSEATCFMGRLVDSQGPHVQDNTRAGLHCCIVLCYLASASVLVWGNVVMALS